jgi:hypothetical protein
VKVRRIDASSHSLTTKNASVSAQKRTMKDAPCSRVVKPRSSNHARTLSGLRFVVGEPSARTMLRTRTGAPSTVRARRDGSSLTTRQPGARSEDRESFQPMNATPLKAH